MFTQRNTPMGSNPLHLLMILQQEEHSLLFDIHSSFLFFLHSKFGFLQQQQHWRNLTETDSRPVSPSYITHSYIETKNITFWPPPACVPPPPPPLSFRSYIKRRNSNSGPALTRFKPIFTVTLTRANLFLCPHSFFSSSHSVAFFSSTSQHFYRLHVCLFCFCW